MRTIEEFERINSDKSAFLQHLLGIGAASEDSLSLATSELEARNGPFVVALGQLPFKIDGGEQRFSVNGWRAGVKVELRFEPVVGAFLPSGKFRQINSDEQPNLSSGEIVEYTQVIGLVRLWNKRARLHSLYQGYLTPRGIRNEVIGRVENWMSLPEAAMALPMRRYAPLTVQAFEGEVARRVFSEFARALRSFLRAYSLAYLEKVNWDEHVYGYFTMLAPGRIASASAPRPVASGLCRPDKPNPISQPKSGLVNSMLDQHLAHSDPVLRRLIEMNHLIRSGEPELALIGCTSMVEHFLNESFPAMIEIRGKRPRTLSLGQCHAHASLGFLDEEWVTWLKEMANARNPLVHGGPPVRGPHGEGGSQVAPDFVRQKLFDALRLYRLVNTYTGRGHIPEAEPAASLDD